MKELLWLALAGALGTLSRYGLSLGVHRFTGDNFPWPTLVVNVVGCFCFALIWALVEHRVDGEQLRLVVLTGFFGAFTTFSTFAFDSGGLLRANQFGAAAGNLVAQNVLGLGAIFLGLKVAQMGLDTMQGS